MPIDAPTWEETADAPTWEDTQTDLSRVKPSPYEAADIASIQAGRGKARTGMEPGTELTEQLYGPLVTHPFQTAARVVAAPIRAAGGMIASALNLVNPQTWVPESQKTDRVFGESPQERAQRHEREQFGVGRPILTPTGTSIDPEGSDLARLLSQWSTPEQAAMLPAGLTRAGAVAMITQMVPQVAQQLYETATGQGTDEEKRDRINNLFSMGVMMAHGRAGTSGATSRLVREAKADVRGRLELPAQEREAFAGRDWTKDIDYHALSRDLAIPGATVMQRPSVVPPEGVVSPVGPMERIPPPRPPAPVVPEGGEASFAPPPPVPPREIGSYQDAVEILRERGNPQLTKAQILAMFPQTIPNVEAAADLALATWGPQWSPAGEQRQLAPQRFGYPEMQRATISPPGPPASPLVSPPEAARAAETMTREATAGYGAEPGIERPPRPQVPGTPAQPRENVLAEIRRRGLDTIQKILAVFPSLEGHREAARVLRNQAWGAPPKPPTPPTPPEAPQESPGGPSAPPGTPPPVQTPPRAPGPVLAPATGPMVERPTAGPKPERVNEGSDPTRLNGYGDPIGSTYRATPEDWAAWQAMAAEFKQALAAKEFGKMTEIMGRREALKNKYGGMPPEEPKATTPEAKPKEPAAPREPAAPGTIGSLSDEQWEAETERITDMVDADNPARESGRINYELNDAVDSFMRYAREQHPDKTIWDAFKAWADEEGADLPTLRKLRSILKDTTATPTAPKESAPTPAPAPGGALIEVPRGPKPLEAERQQIVRLLQSLETEDERAWLSQKARFAPKEGKEDTVKRLRARLAEIEGKMRGGTKPPEPATEPPAPAPGTVMGATQAQHKASIKLAYDFQRRLDAAKDHATVDAIEQEIQQAHAAGKLTDWNLKTATLDVNRVRKGLPERNAGLERWQARLRKASLALTAARMNYIIGEPRDSSMFKRMVKKKFRLVQDYWQALDDLEAAKAAKPEAPAGPAPADATPEQPHPMDTLLFSMGLGGGAKGVVDAQGEYTTPKMTKAALDAFTDKAIAAGWRPTGYDQPAGAKLRKGSFKPPITEAESAAAKVESRIARLELVKEMAEEHGDKEQVAAADAEIARLKAGGKIEAPPAAPTATPEPLKYGVPPLVPAGPEVTKLRQQREKWTKALPALQDKEEAARVARVHAIDSGDSDRIRASEAAFEQAKRNVARMERSISNMDGQIGIARMRDEAAAVKGVPQPEGTQTITSKTLKTQKASLLQQVDAAIKEAPESGTEKITISVPGDGDWTIPNTKESLKTFRAHAAAQFPESIPGDGMPKIPSGKGKALPKVADPKPEDLPKIPGTFASTDESRYVLLRTYADGTQIVGTDGRQLIRVVSDQAPGRPDAPVRLNPDGTIDPKAEGRFPNWQAVADPNAQLVFGGADTAQLLHLANQAKVFVDTSVEQSKRSDFPIELFVNKDKSFGAHVKVVADEFGHNLQEGALRLGKYNPNLLINALNAARRLGNERVDLYMHSGADGALGMIGKNHESLMMPMRGDGPSIRDEPSKFSHVAGRAEHPRLPKGFGPLTNPDELLERTPETGAAGKWNVEMVGGEIKLNQGKEYKDHYGKEVVQWNLVGTQPLSEWRDNRAKQEQVVSALLKGAPIEAAGARSAVAKVLRQTITELVKERDGLVEEVEKRRAAAGTGEVLGFGGAVGRAVAARIQPMTQATVAQVQQAMTPGLNILGKIKQGFASLLLPSAKSPAHLHAAELLGQFIGRMHQRQESAADQMKGASRFFDRMGLEREGVAPAANPGTKFRSDVSMGRTLSPGLQRVADLMDKLLSERLDLLEAAQAPLKTIRDNYFPGIWTMQSRLAFNAALEELIRRGTLPKDIDLNAATPAQRDAVKALTDDYLKAGKGSDNDMLPYLTKRPLAGRESFRKQKVFEDIMHAEQFGLRPVSYNPIDLVKVKLAEMDRSIMMHEYVQALKGQQELKIINPYEEVPKGWQKLDDRYGIIYGKPTVTIPEYIDKAVYEGLVGFAKSLGIKHVRSMKFPPGPGQSALGLSYQGQNLIRSRFATETSVIAHEIGHQLDYRYKFWDRFVQQAVGLGAKGTQTKGASQHQRGIIRQELRNIADLTGSRGGDPRKKVEQIAQMVEAYVHSPEKMKQVAPTVHQVFDDFIKSEPSLKALADIKPGIELTQLTGQKYVGLPIMGYRIVPDAHGDIINNYLSKSLYNNQYFGTLYKGWIGAANSLNQTQLGMGSAFHGGFTTIEAMVSSGANVLKDVYGVIRGNRTIGDLATTAANSIISVGRNPVIGNRVLNAWRERNGTIDPKIAQVVKAMEVAGGGLKLEHGMMTEQTVKMLRNYYSGQYLRAAARSPVALTELMAKPIMEYLVPRQKAGVFAEMAWRVIEQNPGKTAEELAPEFRQAWNRVDARLGQVRYDRLFMRNTAKNVVQALVRAPGWSGGTITEIGGGFTDAGRWLAEFARTGRLPDNLPDRTAYVLSLLTGVMTANGVLTYAFTGQKPTGMDFWAFRTGGKDDYGNEERFVLPSYLKDILACARHPGETLYNKAHPIVGMLRDLRNNKDYYGVEIRGRGDSTGTRVGQTIGYIVKSWEPFWIRGFSRERARGAGAVRQLAPLVGVMPAPRSVTQTAAESLAHDLMLEQIPAGPRTQAEAARAQARSAASRGNEPYLEHALRRLRAPSAVLVLEQANPEERRRIAGMVNDRIANSRTLSDEEKDALSARVNRAGGE